MKKLYILAALLMATTSAQAGGIRFPSRSTASASASRRRATATSLSCIQIIAPGLSGTSAMSISRASGRKAPAMTMTSRRRRRRRRPHPLPRSGSRAAAGGARASSAPAVAPRPRQPRRRRRRSRPLRATPSVGFDTPAPARPRACAPPPGSGRRRAAAAPNSPLGIWATEENKGNVRIEECGANLCGYAVKTGERILINMKPQGCQVDRPDPRSRQRPQLRLDDRDEGHQRAAGPGLRLRRHVLRRPDLEARELITFSPRVEALWFATGPCELSWGLARKRV